MGRKQITPLLTTFVLIFIYFFRKSSAKVNLVEKRSTTNCCMVFMTRPQRSYVLNLLKGVET